MSSSDGKKISVWHPLIAWILFILHVTIMALWPITPQVEEHYHAPLTCYMLIFELPSGLEINIHPFDCKCIFSITSIITI